MKNNRLHNYLSNLITKIPAEWLRLTTHRLDIYNESLAKTEFLDQFEALYESGQLDGLETLPTAYDYIRLGHPLSCVLEWAVAKKHRLHPQEVISFSSQTIALMAICEKIFLTKLILELYTAEHYLLVLMPRVYAKFMVTTSMSCP